MQRHEVYEMLVRLARRPAHAGRRCCVFLTAAAAPPACIETMYGQRWRRAMLTGVSVVLLAVGPALSAGEKKSPVDSSAEGEATAEPEAAPSPLDLDALEQRLRETNAIGFFTKLALASQINTLLDTFRDLHNLADTSLPRARLERWRWPQGSQPSGLIADQPHGFPAAVSRLLGNIEPLAERGFL